MDTVIQQAWTKHRQHQFGTRDGPEMGDDVYPREEFIRSPLQALYQYYDRTLSFLFGHGHMWQLKISPEIFGIALPLCIVGLVYCISRVYVVLESFISLRRVPIGVYQTPSGNFMNYIPHL